MTSPEVAAADRRVLVVPLGSCEQHGPHLPLDTDTRIAVALANGVADARPDAVVAPAVAFGSSGEHEGFAGTLSVGTDALCLLLVELVRSTRDVDHVVLLNGHGGNLDAVQRATAQLIDEGRSVLALAPVVPGGDAHAGRTETSLLLHLDPSVVRLDRLEAGNSEPLASLLPVLRTGGVRAVSANGVLGDPRGASAAEGAELFDRLVAEFSVRIDQMVAR
ncbi:MAG: mycofactocin biosynthesis peptidyl-dipeptidase MftE [Actinobacteria bacterium]|nr:mycofactocin biosynthesis peptidyl-dipeptidase MftE [Actinomycetota bacterium]